MFVSICCIYNGNILIRSFAQTRRYTAKLPCKVQFQSIGLQYLLSLDIPLRSTAVIPQGLIRRTGTASEGRARWRCPQEVWSTYEVRVVERRRRPAGCEWLLDGYSVEYIWNTVSIYLSRSVLLLMSSRLVAVEGMCDVITVGI